MVAKEVVKKLPKDVTTMVRKEDRDDKVYIDALRNTYGQTSVAPYALRATPEATIAVPLTWKELTNKTFNPKKYHMKNIFRRLSKIDDPWKGYSHTKNKLNDILK